MLSRKVLLSWGLKLRRVLLSLANHYTIALIEKTIIMKIKCVFAFIRLRCAFQDPTHHSYQSSLCISICLQYSQIFFYFVIFFYCFYFCVSLMVIFLNYKLPKYNFDHVKIYIHDHVLSFYHFGLFRVNL